ncbi:hypothetical protein HPB48_006709 [Haemaphysalis longicornis]|uniref:Conserved oligomeric Golgi complex subunit 1 n=1 Tax=Haemaphysalis longicornis TaxID=44386 RepID=A0A9J6G532_HAELO|nr:hypothetical protein HPB48_006709 [Haemaphysalis longicornis]
MKLVSGGTDLLFEQYGIKQIHEIEQSIRADIERKKEDLRQMVGERYRDLIEAADTIGQMQQTSANVKQYVAQLTDQCQSLQSKSSTPAAARSEHWALSHHYTVLAEVKLLVDLPSKLWGEAERECWGRAACLQRLGQHVLCHLQLHSGLEPWKALVSRQGTSLASLGHCLNQGLVDQLLGSDNASTREQLCGLATLLVSTLQLVQTAFLSSQPSALVSRISEVTKSNACGPLLVSCRFGKLLREPIIPICPSTCPRVEEQSAERVVSHLGQVNSLQALARLGADLRERLPKELMMLRLDAAMDACLQALSSAKAAEKGSALEQPCEQFTWGAAAAAASQDALALQTRGLAPQVQALCKSLGSELESLLEELQPWGSVEEHLEEATTSMLGRWHTFVKAQVDSPTNADCSHLHTDILSSLGRAAGGGSCKCSLGNAVEGPPPFLSPQDPWQKQQASLRALRDSAYKASFATVVQQEAASLGDQLNTLDHFLAAMLCWGEVEVQEESEGGHQVQSTLRLPLQVTVPLQELLFTLCQRVNRLFGHCMPSLRPASCWWLGWSRLTCAPAATLPSCQTWALQLLMDLLVLNLLFQADALSRARAAVEAHVDPFDLDVLLPHLDRQASLAAQQSSLLLGLCIGDGTGRCLVSGPAAAPATAGGGRAPPGSPVVLPLLASGSPRFPLLPTLSRFLDESPIRSNHAGGSSGGSGSGSLAPPTPPPTKVVGSVQGHSHMNARHNSEVSSRDRLKAQSWAGWCANLLCPH